MYSDSETISPAINAPNANDNPASEVRKATEKPNKETTTESLKWVHITISNVMGNLLVNY